MSNYLNSCNIDVVEELNERILEFNNIKRDFYWGIFFQKLHIRYFPILILINLFQF